jgi:hypothetical protein
MTPKRSATKIAVAYDLVSVLNREADRLNRRGDGGDAFTVREVSRRLLRIIQKIDTRIDMWKTARPPRRSRKNWLAYSQATEAINQLEWAKNLLIKESDLDD